MFFWKKEEKKRKSYDPTVKKPMIRSSICTGEKTAGFRNIQTQSFEEVMLIRDEDDLQEFKDMYGIESRIEEFF